MKKGRKIQAKGETMILAEKVLSFATRGGWQTQPSIIAITLANAVGKRLRLVQLFS